jgi:hypothetical protein
LDLREAETAAVKVFLDMDGVLTDFVRGCWRWFGHHVPYREVKWLLEPQFGFARANEFWEALTREFWGSLEFTPEGQELLAGLEREVGKENIILCSSPSPWGKAGSAAGKIDWIERVLPEYKSRYILSPCKHEAANNTRLLIDDNNDNCAKFTQAGGFSLIVPQPWNVRAAEHNGFSYDVKALLKQAENILG